LATLHYEIDTAIVMTFLILSGVLSDEK